MDTKSQALRVFYNHKLLSYKKIWKLEKYIQLFQLLNTALLSKSLSDDMLYLNLIRYTMNYEKDFIKLYGLRE